MSNENIFADFIEPEEPEEKVLQEDLLGFDLPAFSSSGKNKKTGEKNNPPSQFSDDTHKELAEKAKLSSWKKTVHDEEIKSVQLQRERIRLMEAAGEVGEISFFDFCFVAYMEKINIDTFKMFDRIDARVGTLAEQQNGKAIMQMMRKEFSNVIKSVKIAQANEIKRWKQEQ